MKLKSKTEKKNGINTKLILIIEDIFFSFELLIRKIDLLNRLVLFSNKMTS
jgi:hypothetical protein